MTEFSNLENYFFSINELETRGAVDAAEEKFLLRGDSELNVVFTQPFVLHYKAYPFYVARERAIWNLSDHVVDPVSIALLKDVVVREWDFAIYSIHRKQLLLNSIGAHRSRGDENGAQIYTGFPKSDFTVVATDRIPVIICNDGLRNFWHWHAQTMQALNFLKNFNLRNEVIFVTTKLNSWQRQCLEAIGVKDSEILELTGGNFHFEKAIYPSYLDPRAFIRLDPRFADVFSAVKRHFLIPENRDNRPRVNKIYVSRQDAPHRTMQNEPELIEILEKFGFVSVVPSKMSYRQQVEAFAEADVVVGIHGAGLTNIGFVSPHALLIEIFDVKYMNYVYYVLSRVIGCNYECILTNNRISQNHEVDVWIPDIVSISQDIFGHINRYGFG